MSAFRRAAGAALLLAALGTPLAGGETGATVAEELQALRREIAALREEVAELRKALGEAGKARSPAPGQRAVAAPEPPAEGAVLELEGNPTLGDSRARLVLVEFSDYQCPFCARAHRETLPRLREAYIDPGRLRYVFADFPLASHRHAAGAAEAARCAGEQGDYWALHDHLFTHQRELAPEQLPAHAAAVGLDVAAFEACLANGRQAGKVSQNRRQAEAAGVSATPTFLLGWSDEAGTRIQVVERLRGAQSFARFQQVLDRLLSGVEADAP